MTSPFLPGFSFFAPALERKRNFSLAIPSQKIVDYTQNEWYLKMNIETRFHITVVHTSLPKLVVHGVRKHTVVGSSLSQLPSVGLQAEVACAVL